VKGVGDRLAPAVAAQTGRGERLRRGPAETPFPRRVIGIDPGLHLTGYACVEITGGDQELRLLEAGVLRLRSSTSVAFRLRQLDDDLSGLLDELRPSRMAVERIFVHARFAQAAIVMGHARGIVLLAAERRGMGLDELPPASVKKAITGRGQASKREMQMAIMHQCALPAPPEPPDVADAIAIALTGARRWLAHSSALGQDGASAGRG
jgi:crossover junction endodeoxyribonuclease RuvC